MGLLLLAMLSQNAQAEPACQTFRHQFIDREDVKVWSTTICPQNKLPLHTHRNPRIVIPQGSGILKVVYESGKEEQIVLTKDVPIYLSVAQGIHPHQDINIGEKSLHVIVIELKNQ